MFVGAAGKEAKAAYTSLTRGEPAATLGQDVFAKSVFTRLGPTLSFALVVDTARLGGETPGKEKGTFVLAYGKDPKSTDRAWFEIDMPTSVLTSYASTVGALLGDASRAKGPTR